MPGWKKGEKGNPGERERRKGKTEKKRVEEGIFSLSLLSLLLLSQPHSPAM